MVCMSCCNIIEINVVLLAPLVPNNEKNSLLFILIERLFKAIEPIIYYY
jgi:hypothetical protein